MTVDRSTQLPKVLYIGGTGRTGSTTLDQLVGQSPGWFSAGELAYFWSLGLGHGGLCSCGQQVARCAVWSRVLADLTPDPNQLSEQMTSDRQRFRSLHLPLMTVPGFSRRRLHRLRRYLQTSEDFYRTISTRTHSRVVVDSSKEPHYSYLLREGTSLSVTFVHLVRDPRAVAYSWQRRKTERGLEDGRKMEYRGPLLASVFYAVSNLAAEALWWRQRDRYAFLRYEDFVADPPGTLNALGHLMGERRSDPLLTPEVALDPGRTHTAWGNPDRIGRTSIVIREDNAWRNALSRPRVLALTVINLPFLLRYGYPLRRGGKPRPLPRSRRLANANLGVANVMEDGAKEDP